MTRTARVYSESGFSHVILRGIGRQVLFESADDYFFFVFLMKKYCEELNIEVTAYCLMDNHVHLLLRDIEQELPLYMKKIEVSYVQYYNSKYDRVGHLFQDRYKSEAVEEDSYFLTVLRYILQNPMKAGIEEQPGSYRWSSYGSYAGKPDGLTDPDMATEMLGGREYLLRFLAEKNEDRLLDIVERRAGLTDEQAKALMKRVSGCDSASAFQGLADKRQKDALSKLLEKGLSVRQAARLTGVPKTTVARCAR